MKIRPYVLALVVFAVLAGSAVPASAAGHHHRHGRHHHRHHRG